MLRGDRLTTPARPYRSVREVQPSGTPPRKTKAGDVIKDGDPAGLVPDDRHRRPQGCSDATVEAVGKLTEALEWVERVRGRLYDFHQMIGRADFLFEDAAEALHRTGHVEEAAWVRDEIVGRNVLDGRWTFQVVEEFEDCYYEPIREIEARISGRLMGGRRHVYEAELKERRRTPGRPGHTSRPPLTEADFGGEEGRHTSEA